MQGLYSRASDFSENYCRHPDTTNSPWCHTTDPSTRWERCIIPVCGGAPLGSQFLLLCKVGHSPVLPIKKIFLKLNPKMHAYMQLSLCSSLRRGSSAGRVQKNSCWTGVQRNDEQDRRGAGVSAVGPGHPPLPLLQQLAW